MNTTSEEKRTIQTNLYAKFFSGLSNPTRFRIIEELMVSEKTVGELVSALNASQSQISNHLACLKWCGYVSSRQEGKFVYYQVTDQRIKTIVDTAKEVVGNNADHISSCTRM